MFASAKSVFVRFHRDDEGMEAVQIIMTLAVAALVVLGVTQITGILDKGDGIFGTIVKTVKDFLPGFASKIFGIK